MQHIQKYRKQKLFGGWTRIEMLLAIYDKAIASLKSAEESLAAENGADYAEHVVAGQKAILAIHAGLKPDEHDVAFNVARLLHFVLTCLEQRKFGDAIKILTELRSGFAAIEQEANELEQAGQIPSVVDNESFATPA